MKGTSLADDSFVMCPASRWQENAKRNLIDRRGLEWGYAFSAGMRIP